MQRPERKGHGASQSGAGTRGCSFGNQYTQSPQCSGGWAGKGVFERAQEADPWRRQKEYRNPGDWAGLG